MQDCQDCRDGDRHYIQGVEMKKLIAMSAAAAIAATMSFASDADLRAELEQLKKEVAALKKQTKGIKAKRLKKQISELKSAALHDNIKWSVDYRVSLDVLNYKHADGDTVEKNDLISNRLLLGMKYAPADNLSFFGQLAYYKNFGDTADHSQSNSPFGVGYANFDWITNENATDNTLKVRQAYFVYFGDEVFGSSIPWTASIGRRPSTNGLLVNLRDDDRPASPIGHVVNMEFDGASLGFDLSNVSDVSGMYLKFCFGRGLTNARPRFDFFGDDYTSDDTKNPDIDFAGFIFKPYNDGQYEIWTTYMYAWNLIGFDQASMQNFGMASQGIDPKTGKSFTDPRLTGAYMQYYMPHFQSFGGMHSYAISAVANGVGDGINDFLDDTTAFISLAGSTTDPDGNRKMLGSDDSENGWSVYLGAQIPAMFTEDGRLGFEYNHGSKYWRSFTYGEDTMVGSKLAARGNAYEAYYTQPLVGKVLSAQLRYTFIDYEYTGSNSFFGEDGTPRKIDNLTSADFARGDNPVDEAQDIRLYIRYRY